MKKIGIVSEFNPFHDGHAYLIQRAKQITHCSNVVTVMSGNYVQRGGPAIIDKFSRANVALNNGIDLVVELPFVYASSTAEMFAKGAIMHLNSCNVDYLAFGCECDDISKLTKIAELLVAPTHTYNDIIKHALSTGISYAQARSKAIFEILGEEFSNLISKSNNILAIEYLKQIIFTNSKMQPIAIKRQGSEYNTETLAEKGIFSSATAIRKYLFENPIKNLKIDNLTISPALKTELEKFIEQKGNFVDLDCFTETYIKLIRRSSGSEISKLTDVSEGLENRIINNSKNSSSITESIEKIQTRRYTASRIRRIITNFIVGYNYEDFKEFYNTNIPVYLRILGSNDNGFKIIKSIKQHLDDIESNVQIINNLYDNKKLNHPLAKRMIELESISTDLYVSNYLNKEFSTCGQEFTSTPIIIK